MSKAKKTSRVLISGDTHAPCLLDGYVDFLKDCYDQWDCDRFVHIGDLVDNCSLSFHLKKPNQKDPMREFDEAMEQVSQITEAFPEADLLLGNHDVLPYRWAQEVGIPESMMKDFAGIFELPDGWTVHDRYGQLEIDEVIYQHGDRGRASAILNAKDEFQSCVQGHHHAKAGVEFTANRNHRIFGMQVGCGTDWKHHQQDYGVKYSKKPIIGCGVVLNGVTPVFEPMIL
jgi:hypothetical protein